MAEESCEVRSKSPRREGGTSPLPKEGEYCDLLLLGKTGMGKSTTGDKLLAANPYGSYIGERVGDPEAKEQPGGKVLIEDITIWKLRGPESNVRRITERVKRFTLQRSTVRSEVFDPESEGNPDSQTNECELLSNETSHVRVLDVPGFSSSSSSSSAQPSAAPTQEGGLQIRVLEELHDNLKTMRQIVRIQAQNNLIFHRVLYFLPTRGALERADAILQAELRILEYFFGTAIFQSMIVVATVPETFSRRNAFSRKDYERTRIILRRALELAFESNHRDEPLPPIPDLPIMYISLEESSSELLSKMYDTPVDKPEGLQLHFQPHTCSRCALQFGVFKEERVVCIIDVKGRKKRIAYDESICHPLIRPKYTHLQRFFGGVAYVVLFGIPLLFDAPWPGFFNAEEECAKCGKIGTPGCMKVGQFYEVPGSEPIKVDHRSEIDNVVVVANEEAIANH